jgi:Fibronectin type III domain.
MVFCSYSCFVVTNHLYLLDEPGAPGKPLLMDWDKDHVDLEWPAPKSDGGSPITGYIIQKKEKGSPYWVNAVHVPPKQTSVSFKFDIIMSEV